MVSHFHKSDAEFCGKVPLHQTNLIQPHGYLLIVEQPGFGIAQASENAEALLQKDIREVVNSSLKDYLDPHTIGKLEERFRHPVSGRIPFLLSFPDGLHLATVKLQESFLVLELEKESRRTQADDSFINIYQDLKYIMTAIEEA